MESKPATWLVISTDKRAHGGNQGYDDDVETRYVWDDTVKYHNWIKEGDVLVFFDKEELIGASIIDTITTRHATKIRSRCPHCGSTSIKKRKAQLPLYRCNTKECGHTFDYPIDIEIDVTEYRSSHGRTYVDLEGLCNGTELRQMSFSPKAPDSVKPLDFKAFTNKINQVFPSNPLRLIQEEIKGGHAVGTARVRIGQGAFRRSLLDQFGPICAMTGLAPEQTLEACHLYSYAEIGHHHKNGGLLLRRDLHTLLDCGLLRIDCVTLEIIVDKELSDFPMYWALNGSKLKVPLTVDHRNWLNQHNNYWSNAKS
jgi:hypothetical protein